MIPNLEHRRREAEWMDEPGVSPPRLERSLRFIARVNRFLGYTRATINVLDRLAGNAASAAPMTVLDVATGSADLPRAISRWAQRSGRIVRVVGLDRHPLTSQIALRECRDATDVSIIRGDALSLPFADGSFDFVISQMFLHHLDDADVVRVLCEMRRVARRGVIWADLLRARRAYAWISALTLLSDPIVRHDAAVSVAQGFTRDEAISLGKQAGWSDAAFGRHFGHRFTLVAGK